MSSPPRQQGFRGSRKGSGPSTVETSHVSAHTEQQMRRLTEFEKQLGALDTTRSASHPGSGVRRDAASGGTASGGGAAPGEQVAALERWRAPPLPSSPAASDCSLTARAEERLKRLEKYEAHLDGATSSTGVSPAASEGGSLSRAESRYAAPRAWTGSPAWNMQLEDQLKLAGGAKAQGKEQLDELMHEYLPPAKTVARPQLTHLNGLKAMACLWVVSGHYIQRPRGLLAGMLERGYVPVCFFVVLSGFLTHYSSINKPLRTRQQLLSFHAARLGRILPLHYLMLVAQLHWGPALWANVLGALFLTTSWNCYASGGSVDASNAIFSVEQCDYSPINELHWTLSTLLFSWLMYPLLRPMLAGTYFGTRGKLLVSAAVLLLSQLPALFTWRSGAAASVPRFDLLYRWPPCQLLNFAFGMSVGQLARDEAVLAWRAWPWLVDLATATLCLALLLSPLYQPVQPGCTAVGVANDAHFGAFRCGLDVFWLSGCNLFFGTMLLGGCASSGARSVVIRLANSAVPSDVGLYSFNIYLMQEFIAKVFLALQNASAGYCASTWDCWMGVSRHMYHEGHWGVFDSLWWSIYTAVLIGLAKTWYKLVEIPWMEWVRKQLAPPTRCLAQELI